MQKNFSYELFEKALLYKSLSAYDFCKLAKIHSGTVSNWKNVRCTQCGEKYKQSLESQAKDLVAVIVTALLIIGFFAIMSR